MTKTTKTSSQLDAEIAEALSSPLSGRHFDALTARVEKAVDDDAELTRVRPGNRGREEAELTFSGGTWTASCRCRNRRSKGRGARAMHTADGHGATPDEAVEDFIAKLSITAEAFR